MILNLHSLAFGTETASGGGNPAWGTEMGQGEGYRFSFENCEDLITAMVYKSVPNPQNRIYCPLGKGGNQSSDYEFVLGSLFEKIFVNGIPVNGKFLLLIVKKLVGANHVGRKTLKYNPRMTLDNVNYNENCYNNMAAALGVSSNGSWFVSEINVKNQDELHFTAHVLNADAPTIFSDSNDRTQKLQSKLLAYAQESNNAALETFAKTIVLDEPLQIIFYGAPGTGKSFTIDDKVNDENSVRTTFHPDSDYASFVGAYKPTMDSIDIHYINSEGVVRYTNPEKNKEGRIHPGTEKKIVYKYVPQAFLKAYVAAWSNLDKPFFLVIEEINRGNCAQIFGDLFQLLDRNNAGSSSYAIHADQDIAQFLRDDTENGFASLNDEQRGMITRFVLEKDNGKTENIGDDILNGKKLLLPPNLFIWATMNTSDQSLFPIDSAFKRRWNWKYIPIEYYPIDKKTGKSIDWKVEIAGNLYSWGAFLDKINPEIYTLTESSDKQMGYFFAKADPNTGVISEDVFLNKVLFYLWTDVFKDYNVSSEYFQNKKQNRPFRFTDFFDKKQPTALADFIDNFKLDVVIEEEHVGEVQNVNGEWVQPTFMIDGETIPSMIDTVTRCLEKYFEKYPNISTADAVSVWNSFGLPKHALETEQVFNERTDKTKDRASKVFNAPDGRKFYVCNQLRDNHMNNLIEKAKEWDIDITRIS